MAIPASLEPVTLQLPSPRHPDGSQLPWELYLWLQHTLWSWLWWLRKVCGFIHRGFCEEHGFLS